MLIDSLSFLRDCNTESIPSSEGIRVDTNHVKPSRQRDMNYVKMEINIRLGKLQGP